VKNSHLLPISDLNLLAATSTGREDLVSSFCESSLVDEFDAWVGKLKENELIETQLCEAAGRKLAGLLIGIKDIFASKEFPTSMGTENVWPTSSLKFDARVIDKLRFEGAVVVGKTSTSELAVHASNSTRNPRYEGRAVGTSSTGSAAAVAAGHVPIALATQTAGSIARPSSYCGVIGFKPSFGTLPRTGILKTTDEFDSVGLIGHRVADIEATFDAIKISGPDHPTHNLEARDYKFDNLIKMFGENFDNASGFMYSQMNKYASTISQRTNLRLEESLEDKYIQRVREAHTLIYRRDLNYYLKSELQSKEITETMRAFLGDAGSISRQAYESALQFIAKWRREYKERISDGIVITFAANSGAPKAEAYGQLDCNSLITASHDPQITIPVLRDSDGRFVNVSLSARWGLDFPLLRLAHRLFDASALDLDDFDKNFSA